ncbi:unnamed protein product [Thlaspi arvense]|uniref:Serine/threonine-protein kinase RIO2 n=1 Tax=Thlaspi arvense TaxID=13288 RepID=A0AAU9SGA0_THLAR|nr:unnamed protein product [Thlaspi arvense]
MKLDVNVLRYLSKDDFRVLTAVEMGMRNHEIVPCELVERIACLKHGGTYKVLKNLLKYKLLHHDSSKYDGFRLTYLGYDFLAIKTLVNRGIFTGVGRQIGVGKESDIFEVAQEDGTILAMKLHRLGRTSFRAVKSKRDYLRHRSSFSWLYLSRLAALKEFAFMKALEEHDFPTPKAIDCNRHCVIMSLVEGYPLVQVKQLQNPETVFEKIIGIVVRLAEHGLIHCDFNEFNIMIDDDEKLTMIDFPQMVSVSHQNAQMYFDRDIECIFKFFRKRFNMTFQEDRDESDETEVEVDENSRPSFYDITKDANALDRELEASGFTKKEQNDLDKVCGLEKSKDSDEDEDEDDDEESADEEQNRESNEEENLNEMKSLQLKEKEHNSSDGVEVDNNEKGEDSGDKDEVGSDEEEEEDDAELVKKLGKQRRRAMAAARGGRKSQSSRNTYKDKGKGSQNSKIHNNMSGWPTKSAPSSPAKPLGISRTRSESFHAIHKVPIGDSPYVRAKNVQLVEKDPERAIPLFWSAINAGDRVDSALKDMAIVMKQQDRAEEAIEAIKSLRLRCSDQAQESLDNILLDLYKRCGRLDDQIGLLKHKLFLIQKGLAFNGKRTKTARSQGKKFQVSVEQEATRLLGNLGWALMQRDNFVEAEDAYRRALSIAPDNNKMCNLGICLMKQGRIDEAKETLRRVKPAVVDGPRGVDSHLKAYERAQQMLKDLGSEMMRRGGDDKVEQRRLFESMFGSSSIWQPQPCREQNVKPKSKPELSNDGYGDENVKRDVNVNVNVPVNPLRVDAKPFFSSKLISNNEKLKRTRSSSQTLGVLGCVGGGDEAETNGKRRLSMEKRATDCGLPDNKEFEEAMIMAVLGTETKVDKKRLKVFQDITLSSLSPRA